ncbi:B12-binding domain-containing radical SAM protein [Candidatus Pacearchaeota archaeon]|nr:B12-binding domain-containing radical SAM protein [Candidatus Pacearchaeota archaeon]
MALKVKNCVNKQILENPAYKMINKLEKRLSDEFYINGIAAPSRFYERFEQGSIKYSKWPRITTKNSEEQFRVREDGLKILFINPPIREWSYPNIMPIGQGYVASVAAMDGHRVDVLDLNALRGAPVKISAEEYSKMVKSQIIKKLEEGRPDVIGIGGIITQYGRIRDTARICKEIYPKTPIILGGGIASCMPEFMVKRLPIDIAVNKEGEVIISELLYRIEEGISLEGLRGISYRHERRPGEYEVRNNGLRDSVNARNEGLDHLPWPLRSKWPVDGVYKKNPVGHLNWKTKWIDGSPTAEMNSVEMIASRGCPYAEKACDYCYVSYLGKTYRLRSPKEVVDEMEYISKEHNAGYIHFLDDLLMTDYKWAIEFHGELDKRRKESGFGVLWGGTCRTNIIASDVMRAKRDGRKNILELGYEVGMRQAGYGVETGSPTVLKAIDKSGQTPETIEIAIKETQRVMGYADCSFMVGSPGETKETVRETVDLCKKIGLKPEVFFFTTAYPDTPFWDLAQKKGLIKKAVTGEKGWADEDMIEQYFLRLGEQGEAIRTNFSDLPDEEIIELSWRAIKELGAQNVVRHPHTGDEQPIERPRVIGASRADL